MKEVFEWLSSLDLAVIYTAIVGFVTTWGGSMIALVISVIKNHARKVNVEAELEKIKIELNESQANQVKMMQDTLVNRLDEISKGLISKENEHAQERMDAINAMNDEVNNATKELNDTFNAYAAAKEE